MTFVAQKTFLTVPTLYAAYAYGAIDMDVSYFGSLYDTYTFIISSWIIWMARLWTNPGAV